MGTTTTRTALMAMKIFGVPLALIAAVLLYYCTKVNGGWFTGPDLARMVLTGLVGLLASLVGISAALSAALVFLMPTKGEQATFLALGLTVPVALLGWVALVR